MIEPAASIYKRFEKFMIEFLRNFIRFYFYSRCASLSAMGELYLNDIEILTVSAKLLNTKSLTHYVKRN
ncbi:MAG: hypothetical protein B6D45_05505, partial [Ignavibacteriales bacterium UTCHB3]